MITPELLAQVLVSAFFLVAWCALCVHLATRIPPADPPADDEDWGD